MVKVINISVHEAGLPLPCLGDTLHMTRVRAHSPEATSYVCLSARSAGPWEAMLLDGIYRFSKFFPASLSQHNVAIAHRVSSASSCVLVSALDLEFCSRGMGSPTPPPHRSWLRGLLFSPQSVFGRARKKSEVPCVPSASSRSKRLRV